MIQASKSLSPSHGSFKNARGGVAYQGSEWIARRLNHLKGLGKGFLQTDKKEDSHARVPSKDSWVMQ